MEEKKQIELYLKDIIMNSSDAIFLIDINGKYLFVNKVLSNSIGKTPEEIIDKTIFDIFPKEIADGLLNNVKPVFDTKTGQILNEAIVIQGHETYQSSSLSPVFNSEGKVVAVSGVVRNITDLKNTEKKLHDKIDELSKINKYMVDRELKMVELKKENDELKAKFSIS